MSLFSWFSRKPAPPKPRPAAEPSGLLNADATVPLKRLLATLDRIARCRPSMLILRFERDGVHDVEVGTGLHLPSVLDVPAQHAFEWVPINLTGSAIGARLRKAFIYQNPCWAVL